MPSNILIQHDTVRRTLFYSIRLRFCVNLSVPICWDTSCGSTPCPACSRGNRILVLRGSGAGRGGATILVYVRWYCKERQGPSHAVHHVTYNSSSSLPPALEYNGGDYKISSEPSDVSFRTTDVFLQDQGPLSYFLLNEKSNFDTNRQVSR